MKFKKRGFPQNLIISFIILSFSLSSCGYVLYVVAYMPDDIRVNRDNRMTNDYGWLEYKHVYSSHEFINRLKKNSKIKEIKNKRIIIFLNKNLDSEIKYDKKYNIEKATYFHFYFKKKYIVSAYVFDSLVFIPFCYKKSSEKIPHKDLDNFDYNKQMYPQKLAGILMQKENKHSIYYQYPFVEYESISDGSHYYSGNSSEYNLWFFKKKMYRKLKRVFSF